MNIFTFREHLPLFDHCSNARRLTSCTVKKLRTKSVSLRRSYKVYYTSHCSLWNTFGRLHDGQMSEIE